jgi:hypothetical protein
MTILLFTVPVVGEAIQVFVPNRTPDFMDILHGYLGILAGYCLVKIWREIKPVVKTVQYHVEK